MGSIPSFGSGAATTDQILGTAYKTVRFVAENIEYIKHVSGHLAEVFRVAGSAEAIDQVLANISTIDTIHENLDDIDTLADNIAGLESIATNLTSLLEVHGELPELLDIQANLSTFLAELGTLNSLDGRVFTLEGSSAALDGRATTLEGRATSLETAVTNLGNIVANSVTWHDPVQFATTGNVNLSTGLVAGTVIDGVTLVTGMRGLVKDQTTKSQCGLYLVPASGSASRTTDANTEADILRAAVFVEGGTVNGGRAYANTTPAPITLNTTSIIFVKISDQTVVNANLTAEVANRIAADNEIKTRSAAVIGRFLSEHSEGAGKLISAVGTDRRTYRSSPNSEPWPERDPQVSNPLRSTGFPEYHQDLAGDPTFSYYHMRRSLANTLCIIPVIGASRAGHANDDPFDTSIDTSSAFGMKALMPSVGRDPAMKDFDRLVPIYDYDTTAVKGTALPAMLNTLITKCNAQFGTSPDFVTFSASQGASIWPEIGPGTVTNHALLKAIRNTIKAGRVMGYDRVIVLAVVVNYGQDNKVTGIPLIVDKVHRLNLVRRLRSDLTMLTGQHEHIPFLMVPPTNSDSDGTKFRDHMQAPLELHGHEGIVCTSPDFVYPMSWVMGLGNSGVHSNGVGYKGIGQHQYADVIFEECFGPGFTPLYFHRAQWISGTQVDLYSSLLSGSLVFDTSGTVITNPEWGYYGLQYFSGDNIESIITDAQPVANTAIFGNPKNILRLTITSPGKAGRIMIGTRNTYGDSSALGANAGPISGARHVIHSNAATPLWGNNQTVFVGNPF